MTSDARTAQQAARAFWDVCAMIRPGADDNEIGFVVGSALMHQLTTTDNGDGLSLLGVFRGFAGMAKVQSCTADELIDSFAHVVRQVYASPRVNQ